MTRGKFLRKIQRHFAPVDLQLTLTAFRLLDDKHLTKEEKDQQWRIAVKQAIQQQGGAQ